MTICECDNSHETGVYSTCGIKQKHKIIWTHKRNHCSGGNTEKAAPKKRTDPERTFYDFSLFKCQTITVQWILYFQENAEEDH